MNKSLKNQRGVALVTALLIVAIATTVSASISTQLQVDIRRTSNMLERDQARLYSTAAENLAMLYLKEDSKDNKIDHLEEPWASPYIFPLEEGTLQAELSDLQACINLNGLSKNNPNRATTEKRIQRLLSLYGIPGTLTQSLSDWIDDDLETTIPDGAEDVYYMGLPSPYRAANTYIASPTELNLIRGFEKKESADELSRTICAFGGDGMSSAINVNTAASDVLIALSDGDIDETAAENIISSRTENPFDDINEFMSFGDNSSKIKDSSGLSVSTEFFMLKTTIVIARAELITYSVIHRDTATGQLSIISRSEGTE